MAIGTPVDLGHNQNSGTTSLAITTTAAVNAADFICLCHYANTNLAPITSITDTAGNSYLLATSQLIAPLAEIYYVYNALAEATSSTITVNFAGAVARHGVTAFKVSGMSNAIAAYDVSPNSSNGTATGSGLLTFPALKQPDELQVIMIATAATLGTITWGGSYAAIGGNTSVAFALPAWQTVNSTASTTAQPTWVNSANYRTVGASFRGLAGSQGGGGSLLLGVGS